jgi:hypothetical protein
MQQFRPGMEVMLISREEMFYDQTAIFERIRQFFSSLKDRPTQDKRRRPLHDKVPTKRPLRARTAEAT